MYLRACASRSTRKRMVFSNRNMGQILTSLVLSTQVVTRHQIADVTWFVSKLPLSSLVPEAIVTGEPVLQQVGVRVSSENPAIKKRGKKSEILNPRKKLKVQQPAAKSQRGRSFLLVLS